MKVNYGSELKDKREEDNQTGKKGISLSTGGLPGGEKDRCITWEENGNHI